MPPSPHVGFVASFAELVGTPFAGDVNALCWRRQLPGDFEAVVAKVSHDAGITSIDGDDLRALRLGPDGDIARRVLLADLALLADHGLAPTLDVISGYNEDAASGPITTDVYSFHVDSAPVPADTFLCTYVGACSEAIGNDSAERRIDDAATRDLLLRCYGGADDAGFAAFLTENHYDLHYAVRPGAEPYTFGLGNLWRIAIAYPGSPVRPCIHRAPRTRVGDPARLLLIS